MGNIVILVIEDSEIARRGIVFTINDLGFKTDEAADGIVGFTKATATRYAAIIMDVQLPGLSGIECTAKIREFEQQTGISQTPILGFTAADNFQAVKEACLAAGMNDCRPKSCPLSELQQALKEFVLQPAGL